MIADLHYRSRRKQGTYQEMQMLSGKRDQAEHFRRHQPSSFLDSSHNQRRIAPCVHPATETIQYCFLYTLKPHSSKFHSLGFENLLMPFRSLGIFVDSTTPQFIQLEICVCVCAFVRVCVCACVRVCG